MTSSPTIPTTPLEHPAMDYALLRSEGIRQLERLSGQLWTDFNAHDPGITILEQLCYAITDLGYRINYDIKDLLAGDDDPYRSLHSPAKVLTIDPVTLNDLRKLVIDVPGVKNAWIEPIEQADPGLLYDASEDDLYLKTSLPQPPHREAVPLGSLYRILIETDERLGLHPADILPEVNRRLHACRSLAEDFDPPTILPRQDILVDATIEIGAVEDPERLLAEIYNTLANVISPRIRFYTLTEMLAQGKHIDEVMDGPALEHGFIDNDDLERFQRQVGLRTSDLLQEIMDIDGVTAVGSIRISAGGSSEDWYLTLDPDMAPFLDIDKSLFSSGGPTIRLERGSIQVKLDPARVKENINVIQAASGDAPLPISERDVLLTAGQDRKIGQYYSIQYQFPATYGIGAMGLPESASPARRAQSKQLKAYLMFFDQLLANYFAQLANAKELFSFYTEQPRTYFSQTISDEALGLDEVRTHDPTAHAANVQAITEDPDTNLIGDPGSLAGRKNRFLNHLLARFAEQFTDYSLLQYAHMAQETLIRDKAAFLRDYRKIGVTRGTGFDYTLPAWGSENVSGLEKRISRKLGISTYRKRDLAELEASAEGGFHMLEHILLRPRLVDKDAMSQAVGSMSWQSAFIAQPNGKDPYSHQVSFVFPKWVDRLQEPGFLEFIHKTLREETPAHIRVYVHWLDQASMLAFETAHKEWLETAISVRLWEPLSIKSSDDPNRIIHLKLRDARDRMIQVLNIGLPYPLRDVKLNYVEIIAYNTPATIEIQGGQAGVRYQLCDEDGNAVIQDGQGFEAVSQPDGSITLTTPLIQKDITFTVLATRETEDHKTRLEAYLNQVVSIKAGIDTKLPVRFDPAAGQVVNGQQIAIDYAAKATVIVSKSQEGISYKLVTGPVDNPISLSDPIKGNKGDISLVPNDPFMEDTPISVLAYRTTNWRVSGLLDTGLTVLVRPNPALVVNVEKSILDYGGATVLTLLSPQSSAEYRLFKRDIALSEYLPDATPGSLIVQTDEGRSISVKIPDKITDWNTLGGFTDGGLFKDSNGQLSVSSGGLLEDTLLIVQATKIENREQLQLDQIVAILVRPNTAPVVSVESAEVESGAEGVVKVSGTQKGVHYQLRLNADNTPVNPPGYHITDRGLGTERLEVDVVLDEQGDAVLLLPTDAITKTTTFNVLAIKTITDVSAQLDGEATIGVITP